MARGGVGRGELAAGHASHRAGQRGIARREGDGCAELHEPSEGKGEAIRDGSHAIDGEALQVRQSGDEREPAGLYGIRKPAAESRADVPVTLTRKWGDRGPAKRKWAAAWTTASIFDNESGSDPSRSPRTGAPPKAAAFSSADADRVRASASRPSAISAGTRRAPKKPEPPVRELSWNILLRIGFADGPYGGVA